MYDIREKAGAIREIQRYLLELYYYAGTKAPVIINGIYDAATRAAVLAYQRGRTLPETGIVDRTTWDHLYRDYLTAREARLLSSEIAADTALPLSLGATGEGVRAVKALLNLLAERYRLEVRSDLGNVYTYAASAVAAALQRIYRLPPTGEITPAFYRKLLRDRNYPGMPPPAE